MQWTQFQQFRVAARLQNMTQAAQELAISQPALSRSIGRLEEEVGFQLFERSGRGIRLNSCGTLFLQHVERAMQEIETGCQRIRQQIDPDEGEVALAFLHSLGTNYVPGLVGRFRRRQPKIRFKLYQNGTAALVAQLLSGEADLCLCAAVKGEAEVIWTPLFREELFVAVPQTHPLSGRTTIQLQEIETEPLITFKEHYGLRMLTDALLQTAGVKPEVRFEGEEIMTVAGLVEAGLGVALIPHIQGLEQMKIVFLPVQEPICFRTIGVAWRRGHAASPAVQRFKEFILRETENRSCILDKE